MARIYAEAAGPGDPSRFLEKYAAVNQHNDAAWTRDVPVRAGLTVNGVALEVHQWARSGYTVRLVERSHHASMCAVVFCAPAGLITTELMQEPILLLGDEWLWVSNDFRDQYAVLAPHRGGLAWALEQLARGDSYHRLIGPQNPAVG